MVAMYRSQSSRSSGGTDGKTRTLFNVSSYGISLPESLHQRYRYPVPHQQRCMKKRREMRDSSAGTVVAPLSTSNGACKQARSSWERVVELLFIDMIIYMMYIPGNRRMTEA